MDVWTGSQGLLRAFYFLSHYLSVLSIYCFPLHLVLTLEAHVSLRFLLPPRRCLSTVILDPVAGRHLYVFTTWITVLTQ